MKTKEDLSNSIVTSFLKGSSYNRKSLSTHKNRYHYSKDSNNSSNTKDANNVIKRSLIKSTKTMFFKISLLLTFLMNFKEIESTMTASNNNKFNINDNYYNLTPSFSSNIEYDNIIYNKVNSTFITELHQQHKQSKNTQETESKQQLDKELLKLLSKYNYDKNNINYIKERFYLMNNKENTTLFSRSRLDNIKALLDYYLKNEYYIDSLSIYNSIFGIIKNETNNLLMDTDYFDSTNLASFLDIVDDFSSLINASYNQTCYFVMIKRLLEKNVYDSLDSKISFVFKNNNYNYILNVTSSNQMSVNLLNLLRNSENLINNRLLRDMFIKWEDLDSYFDSSNNDTSKSQYSAYTTSSNLPYIKKNFTLLFINNHLKSDYYDFFYSNSKTEKILFKYYEILYSYINNVIFSDILYTYIPKYLHITRSESSYLTEEEMNKQKQIDFEYIGKTFSIITKPYSRITNYKDDIDFTKIRTSSILNNRVFKITNINSVVRKIINSDNTETGGNHDNSLLDFFNDSFNFLIIDFITVNSNFSSNQKNKFSLKNRFIKKDYEDRFEYIDRNGFKKKDYDIKMNEIFSCDEDEQIMSNGSDNDNNAISQTELFYSNKKMFFKIENKNNDYLDPTELINKEESNRNSGNTISNSNEYMYYKDKIFSNSVSDYINNDIDYLILDKLDINYLNLTNSQINIEYSYLNQTNLTNDNNTVYYSYFKNSFLNYNEHDYLRLFFKDKNNKAFCSNEFNNTLSLNLPYTLKLYFKKPFDSYSFNTNFKLSAYYNKTYINSIYNGLIIDNEFERLLSTIDVSEFIVRYYFDLYSNSEYKQILNSVLKEYNDAINNQLKSSDRANSNKIINDLKRSVSFKDYDFTLSYYKNGYYYSSNLFDYSLIKDINKDRIRNEYVLNDFKYITTQGEVISDYSQSIRIDDFIKDYYFFPVINDEMFTEPWNEYILINEKEISNFYYNYTTSTNSNSKKSFLSDTDTVNNTYTYTNNSLLANIISYPKIKSLSLETTSSIYLVADTNSTDSYSATSTSSLNITSYKSSNKNRYSVVNKTETSFIIEANYINFDNYQKHFKGINRDTDFFAYFKEKQQYYSLSHNNFTSYISFINNFNSDTQNKISFSILNLSIQVFPTPSANIDNGLNNKHFIGYMNFEAYRKTYDDNKINLNKDIRYFRVVEDIEFNSHYFLDDLNYRNIYLLLSNFYLNYCFIIIIVLYLVIIIFMIICFGCFWERKSEICDELDKEMFWYEMRTNKNVINKKKKMIIESQTGKSYYDYNDNNDGYLENENLHSHNNLIDSDNNLIKAQSEFISKNNDNNNNIHNEIGNIRNSNNIDSSDISPIKKDISLSNTSNNNKLLDNKTNSNNQPSLNLLLNENNGINTNGNRLQASTKPVALYKNPHKNENNSNSSSNNVRINNINNINNYNNLIIHEIKEEREISNTNISNNENLDSVDKQNLTSIDNIRTKTPENDNREKLINININNNDKEIRKILNANSSNSIIHNISSNKSEKSSKIFNFASEKEIDLKHNFNNSKSLFYSNTNIANHAHRSSSSFVNNSKIIKTSNTNTIPIKLINNYTNGNNYNNNSNDSNIDSSLRKLSELKHKSNTQDRRMQENKKFTLSPLKFDRLTKPKNFSSGKIVNMGDNSNYNTNYYSNNHNHNNHRSNSKRKINIIDDIMTDKHINHNKKIKNQVKTGNKTFNSNVTSNKNSKINSKTNTGNLLSSISKNVNSKRHINNTNSNSNNHNSNHNSNTNKGSYFDHLISKNSHTNNILKYSTSNLPHNNKKSNQYKKRTSNFKNNSNTNNLNNNNTQNSSSLFNSLINTNTHNNTIQKINVPQSSNKLVSLNQFSNFKNNLSNILASTKKDINNNNNNNNNSNWVTVSNRNKNSTIDSKINNKVDNKSSNTGNIGNIGNSSIYEGNKEEFVIKIIPNNTLTNKNSSSSVNSFNVNNINELGTVEEMKSMLSRSGISDNHGKIIINNNNVSSDRSDISNGSVKSEDLVLHQNSNAYKKLFSKDKIVDKENNIINYDENINNNFHNEPYLKPKQPYSRKLIYPTNVGNINTEILGTSNTRHDQNNKKNNIKENKTIQLTNHYIDTFFIDITNKEKSIRKDDFENIEIRKVGGPKPRNQQHQRTSKFDELISFQSQEQNKRDKQERLKTIIKRNTRLGTSKEPRESFFNSLLNNKFINNNYNNNNNNNISQNKDLSMRNSLANNFQNSFNNDLNNNFNITKSNINNINNINKNKFLSKINKYQNLKTQEANNLKILNKLNNHNINHIDNINDDYREKTSNNDNNIYNNNALSKKSVKNGTVRSKNSHLSASNKPNDKTSINAINTSNYNDKSNTNSNSNNNLNIKNNFSQKKSNFLNNVKNIKKSNLTLLDEVDEDLTQQITNKPSFVSKKKSNNNSVSKKDRKLSNIKSVCEEDNEENIKNKDFYDDKDDDAYFNKNDGDVKDNVGGREDDGVFKRNRTSKSKSKKSSKYHVFLSSITKNSNFRKDEYDYKLLENFSFLNYNYNIPQNINTNAYNDNVNDKNKNYLDIGNTIFRKTREATICSDEIELNSDDTSFYDNLDIIEEISDLYFYNESENYLKSGDNNNKKSSDSNNIKISSLEKQLNIYNLIHIENKFQRICFSILVSNNNNIRIWELFEYLIKDCLWVRVFDRTNYSCLFLNNIGSLSSAILVISINHLFLSLWFTYIKGMNDLHLLVNSELDFFYLIKITLFITILTNTDILLFSYLFNINYHKLREIFLLLHTRKLKKRLRLNIQEKLNIRQEDNNTINENKEREAELFDKEITENTLSTFRAFRMIDSIHIRCLDLLIKAKIKKYKYSIFLLSLFKILIGIVFICLSLYYIFSLLVVYSELKFMLFFLLLFIILVDFLVNDICFNLFFMFVFYIIETYRTRANIAPIYSGIIKGNNDNIVNDGFFNSIESNELNRKKDDGKIVSSDSPFSNTGNSNNKNKDGYWRKKYDKLKKNKLKNSISGRVVVLNEYDNAIIKILMIFVKLRRGV